jgi:anti-sigma factor RsiW
MSGRHWHDDDLIAHLYGLGPEDGHLAGCEACAGRWRDLQAARQRLLAIPPLSEGDLACQREAAYRLTRRSRQRRIWLPLAPAAAALAVAVLAVVLHRPGQGPVPDAGVSDATLYADVYSLSQSEEPEAVGAVHALFETEVNR